ncbi:MAG: glutaredoxin family protein [Galactobacter sp.]
MPQPASSPRVQLITKPGCHLCDDARSVVETVTAQLGLAWEDVDAAGDPDLLETYAVEIPVLMVDGVQRDFWRIDPKRLTRLLSA